jgi:integrase
MSFEETFFGRPNTVKCYQSLYRCHIKPHVEQADVLHWNDQMTLFMLDNWRDLSRRSQITLIRLLGRYIVFMGGPAIDTGKYVRSLDRSEQTEEVHALSASDAQKLMATCKRVQLRFYPVLLLGLHAGLRRGEVFGLKGEDLDVLRGRIRICRSYKGPTKSGKTRYVPMSGELSQALFGTRNIMTSDPQEFVFEQFDPNPSLRALCDQAGVRRIRFHDLRHTFATLALESGVSPKIVQTWLGHSSLTTTLGIYWNLFDEKADLGFLPNIKPEQSA